MELLKRIGRIADTRGRPDETRNGTRLFNPGSATYLPIRRLRISWQPPAGLTRRFP